MASEQIKQSFAGAFVLIVIVVTTLWSVQRVETLKAEREAHDDEMLRISQRDQQRAMQLAIAIQVENARIMERERKIAAIQAKYPNAQPDVIVQALSAAEKYEYSDFPKRTDLIAIVGIESSWRPHVSSNLEYDRAFGLTQVRPGIWKQVIGNDNIREVPTQIRVASDILRQYYVQLNSKRGAVLAYNAGITAYINQEYVPEYHTKFSRELAYVVKHL